MSGKVGRQVRLARVPQLEAGQERAIHQCLGRDACECDRQEDDQFPRVELRERVPDLLVVDDLWQQPREHERERGEGERRLEGPPPWRGRHACGSRVLHGLLVLRCVVCGNRDPHVGEQAVAADCVEKARLIEDLTLAGLQAGDGEHDAALLKLGVESCQHVDRGGVEEGPGLGVEHEPVELLGAVGEREHAVAQVLGVDEERRRVEAVHEQSGHRLGVVAPCDVVVAVDVVDAAEHGIVRTRRAVEEDADREHDRHADARDDAEDKHAAEGDERQRDLGAADVA